MARKSRDLFVVTGPARRDIPAILKRSFDEFGKPASVRYSALIRQALEDIETDPERPGSRQRLNIMVEGARIYHLELSRDRVSGEKVHNPRHVLLYRQRPDGVTEVARILHDARDLTRHLPKAYRKQ